MELADLKAKARELVDDEPYANISDRDNALAIAAGVCSTDRCQTPLGAAWSGALAAIRLIRRGQL